MCNLFASEPNLFKCEKMPIFVEFAKFSSSKTHTNGKATNEYDNIYVRATAESDNCWCMVWRPIGGKQKPTTNESQRNLWKTKKHGLDKFKKKQAQGMRQYEHKEQPHFGDETVVGDV